MYFGKSKKRIIDILFLVHRREFVQLFYENLAEENCLEGNIDIWAFLDCVLDESFEELETHIAVQDSDPCPLLIPTISMRAPLIKKLELNLDLMKKNVDVRKLENVIQSLSSLQHLTELCLVGVTFSSRLPVMCHIGKYCPLLTHLTVLGDKNLSNAAVLALTIGELFNVMFPTENEYCRLIDSTMERLVIPPELRTPICSTLRRFIIFPTYLEQKKVPSSPSAVAFLLRHFPFLEELTLRQRITSSITMCMRPCVVLSAVTAIATTSLYEIENLIGRKRAAIIRRMPNQLVLPQSWLSATLSIGNFRYIFVDFNISLINQYNHILILIYSLVNDLKQ